MKKRKTPTAPQLPPAEPMPSRPAEEQTYSVRVWNAYKALSEQYQSPDVRIDALHAKVGGSLQDLHRWLRQACRDHLAVPSTGEPALADHAAKQSALTLPDETDRATGKQQSFLLIKLLEAPPAEPPRPAAAPELVAVTLDRDELGLVIDALTDRCREISAGNDFDAYPQAQALGAVAEKLEAQQRPAAPPEPEEPHRRYERLLLQIAELRYPGHQAQPQLKGRIQASIARKVEAFIDEQRKAQEFETTLRSEVTKNHADLTPERAGEYDRRIAEMVNAFRVNQGRSGNHANPSRIQQEPEHCMEHGIER